MPYRSRETAMYSKVRENLRGRITSGDYGPGMRLPGELDLAGEFGLSRGTIRQALAELEREGLLTRGRGRGTFVSGPADAAGGDAAAAAPPAARKTVGIVVHPSFSDPRENVLPGMVAGVGERLAEEGFELRSYDPGDEPADADAMLLRAVSDGCVGLVVFPPEEAQSSPAVRDIQARGIPVVALGRSYEGTVTDCAMVNNEEGARSAVAHLVALGHRNIAFVTASSLRNQSVAARHNGYLAALGEAGLVTDPARMYVRRPVAEIAQLLADERGRPDRATAALAVNDPMAVDLIREATARGLRVPEDLAVVGFDDVEFGAIYMVPLTTVAQPLREIGRSAAGLLIDRMAGRAGEALRWLFISPTLVVRRSCGAALSGGPPQEHGTQ